MSLLPSFLSAFHLIETQNFPPENLAPSKALPQLCQGEEQARDSGPPVSHDTQGVKSYDTANKGKTQ